MFFERAKSREAFSVQCVEFAGNRGNGYLKFAGNRGNRHLKFAGEQKKLYFRSRNNMYKYGKDYIQEEDI